jgi:hypothetical protein
MRIFAPALTEVHPNDDGSFTFQPDSGPYVLMTILDGNSGPVIADTRQITVTEARAITIDLGKAADLPPRASPAQ